MLQRWWPVEVEAPAVVHAGGASDVWVLLGDGVNPWAVATQGVHRDERDDLDQAPQAGVALAAMIAMSLQDRGRQVPAGLLQSLEREDPVPGGMRAPSAGWGVLGEDLLISAVHELADGAAVLLAHQGCWVLVWVPAGTDPSRLRLTTPSG